MLSVCTLTVFRFNVVFKQCRKFYFIWTTVELYLNTSNLNTDTAERQLTFLWINDIIIFFRFSQGGTHVVCNVRAGMNVQLLMSRANSISGETFTLVLWTECAVLKMRFSFSIQIWNWYVYISFSWNEMKRPICCTCWWVLLWSRLLNMLSMVKLWSHYIRGILTYTVFTYFQRLVKLIQWTQTSICLIKRSTQYFFVTVCLLSSYSKILASLDDSRSRHTTKSDLVCWHSLDSHRELSLSVSSEPRLWSWSNLRFILHAQ